MANKKNQDFEREQRVCTNCIIDSADEARRCQFYNLNRRRRI